MEKLKSYFEKHLPNIEKNFSLLLKDVDPYVREIAEHILKSGGKRLRPMLCILTARAYGYNKPDIYPVACVLEFIHSATLLHDDIIDHAEIRRGNKAAHKIFGETKTILTGDALLALSNKIVTNYNNIKLMRCLSEAIYQTCAGEILEIDKMKKSWISKDEYFQIIRGKTAYLIQFSCESGAILAEADEKDLAIVRKFGLNLGIAFQLVDDVLDYSLNQEKLGKPIGGDLREGKITLPLILYLDTFENSKKIEMLKKIKKNELKQEECLKIINDINKKGVLKKSLEACDFYVKEAKQAITQFPNSLEKEILNDVVDFVKNREY